MDNSRPPQKPAHLLDDLESIRALLDEHTSSEPPLLTESVDPDSIPLLSEIVEPPPFELTPLGREPVAPRPAPAAQPAPAPAARVEQPSTTPIQSALQRSAEAASAQEFSRLDTELRAAAQLILQDVIDDFVPQIEAELKRRLSARLTRLLPQPPRRG
ncbi:DNA polymerase III subunit chi [Pseudomonas solani]|uniref:DNA polymerase III subunit chi n=1 Tax=Pseudomonas solani TaxID=2731552 RepID=UPI003ED0597C